MARVKGTLAVFKWGANDISQYIDTLDFNPTYDTDEVTGYGKTGHVFLGALTNGTVSFSGTYDSTASTGPRAVLRSSIGGANVSATWRPEGTGAGKPQDIFDCVLTSYTESAPVAGYIKYSATGQVSDAVNSTAQ